MTKAKKKVFTLDDFKTKDLNEKATKMPLLFDGDDTGCYLMVKGIESKSVQRARIEAQVAYADLSEEAEKITDKVERAEYERNTKELVNIVLATELIVSTSFDDDSAAKELLGQNQGLAFSVIAHATTPGNYLVKK